VLGAAAVVVALHADAANMTAAAAVARSFGGFSRHDGNAAVLSQDPSRQATHSSPSVTRPAQARGQPGGPTVGLRETALRPTVRHGMGRPEDNEMMRPWQVIR
jgi:hypothetical protein